MTLEDLKQRATDAGFNYALGSFIHDVEPPHLVATTPETDNFFAEGKVYKKINQIRLELTTTSISPELEDKIETNILFDVCWQKTESTYIPEEKIWNTSYFFKI